MAEIEMVDVTDLFKRLCLENGFRYQGERMVLPKVQWLKWQAGLLAEYLQDDTNQPDEDIHSRRGHISRLGNG